MNDLAWLASLLKSRNTIDGKIAGIIGRPAQAGNIGEYIASIIFRIEVDEAGRREGYDGRFSAGPLAGRTVDVQWHPRQDGLLNIRPEAIPDYYLVLTGPEAAPNGPANPWVIESVYLFDGHELINALRERGVQIGSGTSVTGPLWQRAEIYPVPRNTRLQLTEEERKLLVLFL